MPTGKIKNQRAMTLVEVVVATFILAIGSLAVVQGLFLAKKNNDEVQKKMGIFYLVKSYVDQFKVMKPSELEASTFNILHSDGTALTLIENQWNTIAQELIQTELPKTSLQVNPQVSLQDTSDGKWYTIHLDYRYNLSKNEKLNSSSWPQESIQASIAHFDRESSIVFNPATDLATQTNQVADQWPPLVNSYYPKYWVNTLPKPPIPEPIAWIDTPPPFTYTPGTYIPPPEPNQNNNTSL